MAWKTPKPSETYEALKRQFVALCNLVASLEAQLLFYQNDKHREITARATLDGERAANQALTNTIERLEAEIERLNSKRAETTAQSTAKPDDAFSTTAYPFAPPDRRRKRPAY